MRSAGRSGASAARVKKSVARLKEVGPRAEDMAPPRYDGWRDGSSPGAGGEAQRLLAALSGRERRGRQRRLRYGRLARLARFKLGVLSVERSSCRAVALSVSRVLEISELQTADHAEIA